jgi:hypothetical protein
VIFGLAARTKVVKKDMTIVGMGGGDLVHHARSFTMQDLACIDGHASTPLKVSQIRLITAQEAV